MIFEIDFTIFFILVRLLVQQKAPGFGVQAHRIIKAICELVGIKDIRVKIGKMIIIT